jgi:hypothetical protein
MTILNRSSKGSYALESLQQGDQRYITTEFGTKIEGKKEDENLDENDSADSQGDVFVSIVGEFGKYQLINVILMGLTGIIFSLLNYTNNFANYEVEFWCSKVRRFIKKTDIDSLILISIQFQF